MSTQNNTIGELPELGAAPAGCKELSEYMRKAKPNPLCAEITEAIFNEITMTIQELQQAKLELEANVSKNVTDLMNEFLEKTGIAPDSIYLEMSKAIVEGGRVARISVKSDIGIEL